jgi:hypothetical protein
MQILAEKLSHETAPTPQLRPLTPVSEGEPARRMPRHKAVELIVGILALVMAKPRTRADLTEAFGYARTDSAALYHHVNALHDKGVLYIVDWTRTSDRGQWMPVFAMQPALFEKQDAPRPKPGRAK